MFRLSCICCAKACSIIQPNFTPLYESVAITEMHQILVLIISVRRMSIILSNVDRGNAFLPLICILDGQIPISFE